MTTKKKQLEMEMTSAAVSANRALREATIHMGDPALWELWQQTEACYVTARKRWQNAQENETPR